MSSYKEGPLKRLAKRLGLGKTVVGGDSYGACWACHFDRCGLAEGDNRCPCCRASHRALK